jgi:AcrR family transcriptional regulator
MGKLRATAPEERAARRNEILAAACELFGAWSYSDITMDRIADRAGLAKGTLYLYFRTKEALFLALYEERLWAWYGELDSLAAQGAAVVPRETAARIIASTLASRRILVRLHALFGATFGRDLDHTTVHAFRLRHGHRITALAAALATRVDGLSEFDARRFLARLEAVTGGLAAVTELSASHLGTTREADLEIFSNPFEDELRDILTALLR